MANFKDSNKFETHDDYYTTKDIWSNIAHLLPKDKILWEACMLNASKSKSPDILRELGCSVFADPTMNMLTEEPPDGFDMIVTNIPFSNKIKKEVLHRLVDLDKPFLIIMNSMNMYTKYVREIFKDKFHDLQVINPYGKLQFEVLKSDGTTFVNGNCSFYCIFLAYKMDLCSENLWLLTGKND